MESNINDFNLVGIFCLLIGSLVLAGFPSAVKDTHMEARTFWGANPFVVKNQIIRKYERAIGILLLVAGTACQVVGFSTTKITPFWLNPVLEVIGCVIITAGILKATPLFVYFISSKEFRPRVVEMQRELFEKTETLLKNNGLDQNEIGRKDLTISKDTIKQRLADATGRLNQVGGLIEVPRLEGESDKEYLERLKPFFQ